ncbi:MAG: flagellar brake protein [Ignavibacteria bacterium]
MDDIKQVPQQEILDVDKSFILPVGLKLQIILDGVTITLDSFSIGFLSNHYIIIGYPHKESLGSIANKLFKGNKLTVRYLDGGNIFAFRSIIMGAINDPVKLVFIEYPTKLVRQGLRKDRRVQCDLPALLLRGNHNDDNIISDMTYSGIISDISISGCSFDMKLIPGIQILPFIRMNGEIALHLQLPGIETKVEIFGEIKRMTRDPKKINLGLLFHDVDNITVDRITEYIHTVEKFNPVYDQS